ncbi:MAG: preprotein translocase subunit SecG [Steroidobacteraceae bacterium]
MLRVILTIVQVFSCLAIIGLVLLQRGKGAEAGAGFGAGASGTVFGARGAGTALSRATAIFVAIFMLNSLALAYMGTRAAAAPKSILDTVGEKASGGQAAGKLGVTTTPEPAGGGSATTVPTPVPAPTTTVPAPVGAAPAAPAQPAAAVAPAPSPSPAPAPK